MMADVRRPGVEVLDRRLFQDRFGHVRPDVGRRLGQQVDQAGGPPVGPGTGPGPLLDRDQALQHLFLAVGGEMAGGQPPHVLDVDLGPGRQRAAPIEDHRLHGPQILAR